MAQPVATPLSVVGANTTKLCYLDCDPYQIFDNGRDIYGVSPAKLF
jgi:hypothetical protein